MDGLIYPAQLVAAAAQRLRRARLAAGYKSAAAFSRLAGVNTTTYQHHECGRRGIDEASGRSYAKALGVSAEWLLYGHRTASEKSLRRAGVIRGDGVIVPDGTFEESRNISDPAADAATLECLEVEGNGLFPAYRNGDLVFYAQLTPLSPGSTALNGVECICELADGQRMIRQIIFGPHGRATLIGYSTPPVTNVVLVAASPVLYVRRHVPIQH